MGLLRRIEFGSFEGLFCRWIEKHALRLLGLKARELAQKLFASMANALPQLLMVIGKVKEPALRFVLLSLKKHRSTRREQPIRRHRSIDAWVAPSSNPEPVAVFAT